ncbi:phage tail protein [Vibrio rumoiensis]|uniref:phage tail-collar fiber domain-containing protein n=1 Tax=Vibrio rumoiensis TaxID=76258 RepID=UPI003AA8841A
MADEPLKTAVLTNMGIAKLDAAYQAGTKITIAEMAFGNSNLEYVVPDPAFTQLVNEFGRQPINEGNTSDTWINAIVYVDSTQFAGKSILEFGLYDDEGDLIVYSSYTPSVIPSVGQDYIQLEIECSVDLYNASAVTIEVTPIYPQATELERGIAKIATNEDIAAGVDDEKIVTAKKLAKFVQGAPYNPNRTYKQNETCTTFNTTTGELESWTSYAPSDNTGNNPQDPANRHDDWPNFPTPCWWIKSHAVEPGTPVYWFSDDIPENALQVMDMDIDAGFYHRIAKAYPSLIVDGKINLAEICGRYIRIADGSDYVVNKSHNYGIPNLQGTFKSASPIGFVNDVSGIFTMSGYHNAIANDENSGYGYDTVHFSSSMMIPNANEVQPKSTMANLIIFI